MRKFSFSAILALGAVFGICENSLAQIEREVLVQGGGDLSSDMIRVVAQSLTNRPEESAPADGSLKIVRVQMEPDTKAIGDLQFYRLTLIYRGDAGQKDSEKQLNELWEKGRQQLETALRQVQRAASDRRVAELDKERSRLNSLKDVYRGQVDEAVAKLDAMESNSSGTAEQMQQQLADTINKLRQLKLDRIGIAARREAIEKRIDEVRHAAEQRVNDDPVLDELETIVKIRQQQFAAVKGLVETGVVGGEESALRDAETNLAQARIELLKAKRIAATDANGAMLASLNDELSKLFVEDAELKAKSGAMEKMINELREQTSFASRARMASAEQDLKRYRAGLDQAEQAIVDIDGQHLDDSQITIRPLEDVLPAGEASP